MQENALIDEQHIHMLTNYFCVIMHKAPISFHYCRPNHDTLKKLSWNPTETRSEITVG